MTHEPRRVLFLQFNPPGAYPPVLRAIDFLNREGVRVFAIGARADRDLDLLASVEAKVRQVLLPRVSNGLAQTLRFALFTVFAVATAIVWRADVVYASDAQAAVPVAFLALLGRRTIYHEHDSPAPGSVPRLVARCRDVASRRSELCIIPNADRAASFKDRAPGARVVVVPNYPSLTEVYPHVARDRPTRLYYHGSIIAQRLPVTVIEALAMLSDDVSLRFAGYETMSGRGHVKALLVAARERDVEHRVTYLGPLPHTEAMRNLRYADIGLGLVVDVCGDANLMHLAGASVKVFEYMATGVVPLLPDTEEWRPYIDEGLAAGCDPTDASSITAAIEQLRAPSGLFSSMSAACVNKIRTEWNFESVFRPVARVIE